MDPKLEGVVSSSREWEDERLLFLKRKGGKQEGLGLFLLLVQL